MGRRFGYRSRLEIMKVCMFIEFSDAVAASATETEAGYMVLISRLTDKSIELLSMQSLEIKGKIPAFLRSQLINVKSKDPLDAAALRANLSSPWGSIMTEHLFRIHEHSKNPRDSSDVVEYTAWCYSTLIDWGEASAAREIALRWEVPVRTIQNRLRLARERGILKSPGQGSRLGK